ncbi:unnamed protein product [Cochlearia groenlandica]
MANQNGSSSPKQESSQNAVVERTSVVQRPSNNGGLSVLMKTYPPKSTYICTYCDRIFFSYHGLRVHTASHKSGHDELERPLTMNPVSSGLGVSLDPSNTIGGSTNNNITSVVPPLGGGPTGGISDMTLYHRMSHHLSSGMSVDPSHAIGGSSVVPPISSGTSRGISGMNMTMYDRVVTPHLSSGMSLDPSRTIGGGMSNNNTNTVVPRIGGRTTRDISDMNMTMYHQTSPHFSNGRSLDPSRTIGGSRNNNNNNNTSVIPPISSGTTRGISGMNMTMYHQARPHLSNGMSLHPSHTIGGSSNNITSVVPRISSGTTRDISDTYSSLFEQMRHYVSTGRPLYPSNTIGGSSNNMVPPTSSGATRGISSMNMAMYHHQMNPHHSSGMSLYPSHIVGGSNNNNNNITSMVPPFRSGTNRNIPGMTMDMYHNHHQANPHISSGESLYPSHTIGSGGGNNNNNNNFTSMVPPFRRGTNGGIPGMTRAMYHNSDQVNRINSLSRDANANQNMNVTKNLFDNNHSPHDNHLDLTLGPSKPKEDPGNNNNNNNNVIREEVHVDKEVAKIWGRDLSLSL